MGDNKVTKGDIRSSDYSSYGLFPKLWAPFGYRLHHGTLHIYIYIWVPKQDPKFGKKNI